MDGTFVYQIAKAGAKGPNSDDANGGINGTPQPFLVSVDSEGNVYTGEVDTVGRVQKFIRYGPVAAAERAARRSVNINRTLHRLCTKSLQRRCRRQLLAGAFSSLARLDKT
jgi:hypothetical protein